MKQHSFCQKIVHALAVLLLVGILFLTSLQAVSGQWDAQEQDIAQRNAERAGSFQTVDCSEFQLSAGLDQSREVECGYITVPEEYSNPKPRTIRLGVVVLKSRAENVAPYPLFMMQGGPGGSTIHDFPLFLVMNPRLLGSNRDIVLFDQRGTMNSQPRLDCPEQDELTLQTLNQDLSSDEALRLSLEAMQRCRDRLQGKDINLSAYDSLENAADVDAIRKALGYEKIDLYGVSYGTLLALQVMRLYPEGLRTVVLDSVVAPQINDMLDGVQPQVRALEKVFQACAASEDCRQSYPELENVFYEQVNRLNAAPVQVQLTDTDNGKSYDALLDGDAVIYAAIMMMFSTESIPLVPRMVYDVRAGNYQIVEQILSSITFDRSYSWGMFYSVKCAEEANYSPEQVNDQDIPEQFMPLSKDSTESFLKTCALWDVMDESARADDIVESDIPTLILSGGFDPTTPPAYAEEAAKTLPNSYAYLFPSGGHGELFSFSCAQDIMFAFLDDPATRPDGSCIPQQDPEFVTAKSVVRLPVVMRFLMFRGTAGLELALFGLGLSFLLTAIVVYPAAWFYGWIRGRSVPAVVPANPAYPVRFPDEYPHELSSTGIADRRRPPAWKAVPWLVVLTGGMLVVFTTVLAIVIFTMAAGNDMRVLVGVSGAARPLFILPVLAAALVVGMVFLGLAAWARGWGSVWGRLYFTLQILAAGLCVAMLGYWGMLTALLP